MARVFLLMLVVGMFNVESSDGHCTKDDASCEFYLTVAARMTMWRGVNERVYINKTDCNPYVYNTNEPVQPEEVILADGSENIRALMVVNGTMPGPALTVYVNQEITVHVTNHLVGANVAIHWHGLSAKGTPWMDGAAFITQCPILPGQTFTYRFVADRIGTHFYHAHAGGAISMGLFGPFIVKELAEDVYEEHVLTVQDFNNRRNNEEIAFTIAYGNVFDDGTIFMGYPTSDREITATVDVTSQLINGRGRIFDTDGTALTCTKWPVFEVLQGRSYRFRVINAAFAYQSTLSVDQHPLSVIALDGHELEPVNADRIYSHSGERFDFILTADQPMGNYWIRLDSVVPGRFPAYAILRYIAAGSEDPTSESKDCTRDNKCTWLNCPFESYANVTCINVDDLKAADTTSSAPPASGRFREFFLNLGFARLSSGTLVGHINGKSFEPPTVSALTQPQHVTNRCTEEQGCGIEKICRCVGSLDIRLGDVIQLNLLNVGFLSILHHPIHTHGYNFHVLKIGHRPTNDSFTQFGPNSDVTCNTDNTRPICNNASWSDPSWTGGNIPGIELSRAPLKDTLTVPAGGYAVVRFVVDNPGLWFVHCHMEWHSNVRGMGILLNDSFTDIPRPPRGFPTCGNFYLTPEDDDQRTRPTTSPVTQSTTQASTTTCPTLECDEDFKFTRVEFWTTLGVLLFIITLQFILAVFCLTKKGSASKYNM